MSKLLTTILLAGVGVAVGAQTPQHPTSNPRNQAISSTTQSKLEFIPNKGQWDRRVRFLGHAPGIDMWITDQGITYEYHKIKQALDAKMAAKLLSPLDREKVRPPAVQGHVVRISFVGKTNQVKTEVSGFRRKAYTYNYFIGKDKSKWVSGVPVFSAATVKGIYKGIDLVAYFDEAKKLPRYDLVIHPGADASKIAMRYEGADKLHLTNDGTVAYQTSLGKVEERDLFAYQPKSGTRIDFTRSGITAHDKSARAKVNPVSARMAMAADGTVRFKVGPRDPSVALVVDPLIWSTYLTGDSYNSDVFSTPPAVVTGPDGSPYMAGFTIDPSFPTTPGAFKNTFATGYISKFSTDGSTLQYCTFFGGGDTTLPYALAIQANGSVVVGGVTNSPDYPTTPGAFGNGFYGADLNNYPAFVTKFTPDGTAMEYSVVAAGVNSGVQSSYIQSLKVDNSGAVYMAGADQTDGLVFGVPGSAYEGEIANQGSFCAKLSPDGSHLVWGTYFATNNYINDLAIDDAGNAYVTGMSVNSFAVSPGAYQGPTRGTNSLSAFVTKINADGASNGYALQLNGTLGYYATATSIAVDTFGNAYVAGQTNYLDFPTSSLAYNKVIPGGTLASFFSKVTPDGSALAYSTYGPPAEFSNPRIASFPDGSLALAMTEDYSTGTYAGPGAYQTWPQTMDGYVSYNSMIGKLSADGSTMDYLSYLGGGYPSTISSLTIAPGSDSVYVGGKAIGFDFPTTEGAYQTMPGTPYGGHFLAKFQLQREIGLTFVPGVSIGGATVNAAFTLPNPVSHDTVVFLSSSSPKVHVPASVIVSEGSDTATFPVTSPYTDSPIQVQIRASIDAVMIQRYLTLAPPSPLSVDVTPDSFAGARKPLVTIQLNGKAGPQGTVINLVSSNPAGLPLPATVKVAPGKDSIRFSIAPQGEGSFEIGASSASSIQPAIGTFNIGPLQVSGLTLASPSVYSGGKTIAKINLTGPAPIGGTQVTLSDSDPSLVTVPGSVTVPAGSTYVTFEVKGATGYTGADQDTTITATYAGSVTATETLKAYHLTALNLSTNLLVSGNSGIATVTLNGPAPDGGAVVNLTSSDPTTLPTPGTVNVPAGSKTASVTLTLPANYNGPVKAVTITASAFGDTLTKSLSVKTMTVSKVSVSPVTVTGGNDSSLTINLTAVTSSPTVVTLSNDSAYANVPATVTVPAGASSVTIPIYTTNPLHNASAHITATYNGVTKATVLNITHF